MGAQASTAVQDIESQISTTMNSKCTPSANVQQKIRGVKFTLSGKDTHCDNFSVINEAVVSQSCDMDSSADVLAKIAAKSENQVEGGFGIGLSASVQKNKTIIKNKLEQECSPSTNIDQEIAPTEITIRDGATCNDIKLLNSANAQQNCVMAQVIKTISDSRQGAKNKTKGFDPTALMGITGGIMALCVCCVCGLLVVAFMSDSGKQAMSHMNARGEQYMKMQGGGRNNALSLFAIFLLLLAPTEKKETQQ